MRSSNQSPATTALAIALTAGALLGISAIPAGAASAPAKPNIVVIMSDDQRQDDTAIMRKLQANMPNATSFANSYVSYSLCCPSRTTFLTGQYMHNHGITWNFWPEGGYHKFKHSTSNGGWSNTMPKWLQNAGYNTGLIGKFLNEYGTDDPTTKVTKTATGASGSKNVTVTGTASDLAVGMRVSGSSSIPDYTLITAVSGNTVTLSNALTAALTGSDNFVAVKAFMTEVPPGWTYWMGGVDPTTYSSFGYWLNENGKLKQYGHCARRVNFNGATTKNPYAGCAPTALVYDSINKDGTAYQTDVLATKAEGFISTYAKKSKPFFLWLTPNAPHTQTATGLGEGLPATPPKRYENVNFDSQWQSDMLSKPNFNEADISDKPPLTPILANPCDANDPLKGTCNWFQHMGAADIAVMKNHFVNRRRAVLGVDDMVDRVYKAVKKAGKLSNTIFIFTSDNGWLMGEHRVPANKLFGFDESIRVPLIISGPGFTKTGGRTVTSPAVNADVTATILQAAGATAGRSLDGVPLQNLIANPTGTQNRFVAIETGQNPRVPWYSGLHSTRWHLEKIVGDGILPERFELYDLTRDPFEINAVTNDPRYAGVLAQLKAKLTTIESCTGRTCDVIDDVTPPAL